MKEIIQQYLKLVERDASGVPFKLHLPRRANAPEPLAAVVIDPKRGFGRPVLDGRGIRTEVVVERFQAGESIASLAEDYGLDPSVIEDILRVSSRLPHKAAPKELIFFVDRSLGGKLVVEALRAAGAQVIAHDDAMPQDSEDVEWLAEAGRHNWVVLTKDSAIRRNQHEKRCSATRAFACSRWRARIYRARKWPIFRQRAGGNAQAGNHDRAAVRIQHFPQRRLQAPGLTQFST
ncbi:MAG: DUF433 domain-containing protein [Xanthomonadales bacterium]|nr:DUF433 domain-containing protein [Xanthomonadales bacterium]